MRLIFVDTETTGLAPRYGHRIVELACDEMLDGQLTGRAFHHLVNPQRPIPPEVSEIHGINDAMLQDKPVFSAIAHELIEFVGSSRVVMHNAPFDTGFFQSEFERLNLNYPSLSHSENVADTLPRFRALHPGQKCNLSALCERHNVQLADQEDWHGALTDARMLARLRQAAGLSV